ncbi:hypothetical protein ABD97_10640, partial [Bacillus mycoides]|nr:hypothetical protein [Bacillus mycoides]
MSSSQKRLWFFEEFTSNKSVYNLPYALRLTGSLHVKALEESLQEIVARHESLRTTFAEINGDFIQVVHSLNLFTLPVVELEELGRESTIEQLIQEEALNPFNLKQGPLFRAFLIKVDHENHVLVWNMHHIISDGWSMGVFHNELSILYSAFSNGDSSPLPELEIQYVDFAEWHREWLQSEEAKEQLEYWKKTLAGNLPVLQIPTDRPRLPNQTFQGNYKTFDISFPLMQKIKHLSQTEGVTLFTVFLAVYKTLLHRYTSQEDLLIGTPIAGRKHKEIEGLIGFFVNTLVLRSDLSGDPKFSDLLQHVSQVSYKAFDNQDLPFDKVVEEIRPQRNQSHPPLFQVMFAFQNSPMKPLELDGLTLTPLKVHNRTSKFDLILFIEEDGESLRAGFEYNTDLFDDETISRMWQHYITLLESVVNNPEQSISQLPMLTMEEKKQALLNWNNTNVEYPRERCIQDLFEEQVRQNPDAIALRYLEQSMTYSQLNQQANQLAHYLKKQGVTPQTMVGLCVERSMDMIIGILGILKVGGIYVPLDASYPEERLRFMIEDAKISVLVTQSHMKEVFPCDGMTTVMVDHDWKKISQESLENPRNELTGEHIAYVNYTSGSTGKPKGVVIPHRGVLRLVKENNYVRLTSKEILLQFAPVSFDAATFEIWGSLLNGAQLVIYPYGQASLEELGQVLRQNKVSTLWLTAGLFHQMVEYRLEDLKGVRQILAGGDVLSPVHVRKVLEELDDCLLINGYGPTENTTFTCCYPMSDVSQVRHTVPIGRPIANTQVYVLDQQLQPVPIGIPGELYIGGDGLALEYLNQPALTKEKFIPHLFSDDQEAQLYKTGDLVRYLPDGNIEFLGRTDNQVKIRGFRIELGEIE